MGDWKAWINIKALVSSSAVSEGFSSSSNTIWLFHFWIPYTSNPWVKNIQNLKNVNNNHSILNESIRSDPGNNVAVILQRYSITIVILKLSLGGMLRCFLKLTDNENGIQKNGIKFHTFCSCIFCSEKYAVSWICNSLFVVIFLILDIGGVVLWQRGPDECSLINLHPANREGYL